MIATSATSPPRSNPQDSLKDTLFMTGDAPKAMGRFKGRKAVACQACHGHKVKCSGEKPCQRCKARGRDCVYPVRDRLLAVPESYLREVERQATLAKTHAADSGPAATVAAQREGEMIGSTAAPAQAQAHTASTRSQEPLLGDSSAERFVQKLKEASTTATYDELDLVSGASPAASSCAARYSYSRLSSDFMRPEVSFKLPPKPYAFHLLSVFEEGFCDYHFYRRAKFRDRLHLTYSNPGSQAGDRNWFCRVSVVLALAESWDRGRNPSHSFDPHLDHGKSLSSLSADAATSPPTQAPSPLPPGSDFFEQALLLLNTSLEEPVVEDVEALNLIAFYCYSLNRRKTAYSYAGQSIRLARLLCLDEPTSTPLDAPYAETPRASEARINAEHRKRVWWTSFCMDRMVSTELGLPPLHESVGKGLSLPSNSSLLMPHEQEEFFDHQLLSAQAELCIIKDKVVDTVTNHLRLKESEHPLNVLGSCIDIIQRWRTDLPINMSFTFPQGIPPAMLALPCARILASLYLRYHQCFILLLRPLFLQEISALFLRQKASRYPAAILQPSEAQCLDRSAAVMPLKLQCLDAARNNARILIDLWRIGKIAKFGYWESLHLFSSLSILSLSQVVIPSDMILTTGSIGDAELFVQARALLEEMARVGNLSAKDHLNLLADVEDMVTQALAVPSCEEGIQLGTQDLVTFDMQGVDMLAGPNFGGLIDEQVWHDLDWENLLRGWAEINCPG